MGVGKAVFGSHGPSSMVRSENGPYCGTITYFVGGKKGRIWFNIICLKLYQFQRFFCCLGIYYGIYPKIYHTEKTYLKSHGLLTKIPGDHEILSIVCHVGLHVDFSSMKFSLGL